MLAGGQQGHGCCQGKMYDRGKGEGADASAIRTGVGQVEANTPSQFVQVVCVSGVQEETRGDTCVCVDEGDRRQMESTKEVSRWRGQKDR